MPSSEITDHFEEISEMDSSAIFKPTVPALVVTDSEETGSNIMTASWWMLAGYNPLRYLLAVSQKTFTHDIIQNTQEFVLAAPSTDLIEAVILAGKVSGRDLDKIDHLDLDTVPGNSVDVPLLTDAVGNIEIQVMDSFEFEDTTYFFGEVAHAYVAEGDLNGRILSLDSDILAYMGSDWESDDAKTKARYYAKLSSEDLESFPGDRVIESLPEELKTSFE